MFHRRKTRGETGNVPEQDPACSFCNQKASDTRKIIAGPAVFICSECVDVCVQIIRDDERFKNPQAPEPEFKAPTSEWPPGTIGLPCRLCGMQVSVDEAIAIEGRGALCVGCVDAIEATVAVRRGNDHPLD